MTHFSQLIHRYRHTLVIVSILLPLAVAVMQSARLHYLEVRHHRMLADFTAGQMRLQMQNAELAQQAATCKAD